PDVALADEVEQGQAEVGVIVRDFDHEAQVGLDHLGPGLLVAALDACGQFDFLLGSQQGDLPDFPQVNLDAVFAFSIAVDCHGRVNLQINPAPDWYSPSL